MAPMEPLPETAEALRELGPASGDVDLVARLTDLAGRAQRIVPDLVGVSVARLDEGVTFTLVATAKEIAVLDAIQYVAGGPCVDAAEADEVREFGEDDVLDEERWGLFAEATAARAVRSTLTLPVLTEGDVTGTVNLYAGSRRAFVGHHDQLAEVFDAWAAGAVANADLSFATRREAQAAPGRLRERAVIDVAVGILVARLGIDPSEAEGHLRDAAARAGEGVLDVARAVVDASRRRHTE